MDYIVKVQFWDTAGQERFNYITKNYYRRAHDAVIVYDITQRGTFEAIPRCLCDIREANSDAQVLLVGNKDDMEQYREVPTEEAVNFARLQGVSFLETSALKGTNCAYSMQIILQDLHRAQQERARILAMSSPQSALGSRPLITPSNSIKLTVDESNKEDADDDLPESDGPATDGGCAC